MKFTSTVPCKEHGNLIVVTKKGPPVQASLGSQNYTMGKKASKEVRDVVGKQKCTILDSNTNLKFN